MNNHLQRNINFLWVFMGKYSNIALIRCFLRKWPLWVRKESFSDGQSTLLAWKSRNCLCVLICEERIIEILTVRYCGPEGRKVFPWFSLSHLLRQSESAMRKFYYPFPHGAASQAQDRERWRALLRAIWSWAIETYWWWFEYISRINTSMIWLSAGK